MCLWFAIGYYNSYVTYLLVPTQNTPIADLNATLGLNNDNSIRLETREGGSGDQLSIIDSALVLGFFLVGAVHELTSLRLGIYCTRYSKECHL
jgi:hypothetical protein